MGDTEPGRDDLGGHDLSGHDSGGHGVGGGEEQRVRAFGVAPDEERAGSAAEETAVPADDLNPLEGDR